MVNKPGSHKELNATRQSLWLDFSKFIYLSDLLEKKKKMLKPPLHSWDLAESHSCAPILTYALAQCLARKLFLQEFVVMCSVWCPPNIASSLMVKKLNFGVLSSDETKIELFDHQTGRYVWRESSCRKMPHYHRIIIIQL